MKRFWIIASLCVNSSLNSMESSNPEKTRHNNVSPRDNSIEFPSKDDLAQKLKGKIPATIQPLILEMFPNQIMTPQTASITLNSVYNSYIQSLKIPESQTKARHHFDAYHSKYLKSLIDATKH